VLFAHQSAETYEVQAMLMEQNREGLWGAPRPIAYPADSGGTTWHTPVDGSPRLYAYTGHPGIAPAPENGDCQLWFVDWIGSGWSAPYPVQESTLGDGMVYFSAVIAGGAGGEDVYTIEIEEGRESAPKGVGRLINTEADEYVAAVPKDSSFMVFYRYHPEEEGNRGLFISFRAMDRSWSPPASLDSLLHLDKPGFDASLSPGGDYLFVLERGVGLYWMDVAGIEALKSESSRGPVRSERARAELGANLYPPCARVKL
jgi:hypothetical protein